MPWQAQVANVAGELDRAGIPAYREVRVTVPRQSGKTSLLLAEMVERAIGWGGPQRIVYTAQDRNAAREKWDEQVRDLDRTALARLYKVRRSNGSERIAWANGSIHGITATGETSGHGRTLDLAVIDEAFAQTDERLIQGFRPAMVTRRAAQLWVVSTAGTDTSTFLRERVQDGRARVEANERTGVAYFEWSAPDDAPVDDPAVWRATMPALGRTVDEATIAAELPAMGEAEFARAYLNRWSPGGTPAIPIAAWQACRDAQAAITGSVAFAIDVDPDRAAGSIAVAGRRRDGRIAVELVDARDGTEWIVPRVGELVKRWRPVAVALDPASPAGSLIAELAMALRVEPLLMTARSYGQACGALYDDVVTGRLVHRGQPRLDEAVLVARRRPLGEAWAWARRGGDITPLVAATIARWAWATTPEQRPAIY